MKTILAAVPALVLAASTALAQPADPPWTVEEFLAAHPDVTAEVFEMIDTNSDGLVDAEEYEAAIAAGLVAPAEG